MNVASFGGRGKRAVTIRQPEGRYRAVYRPFPKYKCKAIAHDVTLLLRLVPGLEWWQVKDYYEPRLPGIEPKINSMYDEHKRALIARALDRELRYQHVRRP